jgi:hypothetical protein
MSSASTELDSQGRQSAASAGLGLLSLLSMGDVSTPGLAA